ncbi:hypothetical protein B0H14DRAFT_2782615 [Mycena olivaceomarginata]|nr:hypothetical protein B0H14DRAFT_2782615 [Mycena olivaceomarginata]
MASTQSMFLVISTPCLTIPVSCDDSGSSESPSDSVSLPYCHNIFFSNMFPPSHWAFFPQIIFAPTVVVPTSPESPRACLVDPHHRLYCHCRWGLRDYGYRAIDFSEEFTSSHHRRCISMAGFRQQRFVASAKSCLSCELSSAMHVSLLALHVINAVSCTRTLSTSGCRPCSICSSLIRPPTSQGLC